MQAVEDAVAMAQNQSDNKKYNQRLFFLTTTLVHEVTHVLGTYLIKDKSEGWCTPPKIDYPVQIHGDHDRGEAGRFIEQTLFGGVLALWHADAKEVCRKPCWRTLCIL